MAKFYKKTWLILVAVELIAMITSDYISVEISNSKGKHLTVYIDGSCAVDRVNNSLVIPNK